MSLAASPGLRDMAAGPPDTAPRRTPARLLDDRRDPAGLAGLAAVVVAVHAWVHRGGVLVGMDVATQFIPWFGCW